VQGFHDGAERFETTAARNGLIANSDHFLRLPLSIDWKAAGRPIDGRAGLMARLAG